MAEQIITSNIRYSFFNSVDDDRLYDAKDLTDWLATTKTNGVLTRPEGQLKVTAANGMNVSVSAGVGIIDGTTMYLDTATTITVDAASTAYPRIDRIGYRIDYDNRRMTLFYKSGVPSDTPTAPELVSNTEYKELSLATIYVAANTSSITNSMITDTREFAIATETIFQERTQIINTTAQTSSVAINVDYTEASDIVRVLVNGNELNSKQYSISGKTIAFTSPILSGNTIEIKIWHFTDYKNVTGIDKEVADIKVKTNNMYNYYYFATGTNDNIALSNIAQSFLAATGAYAGADTYAEMKIIVCGDVGVTTAYEGTGTSNNPYIYFKLGRGASYNETRRIHFDFSNTGRFTFATLNGASGVYHNIFYGNDVNVSSAKISVSSNGNVTFFDGQRLTVRDCELYGTVEYDVIGFKCCGMFENNKVSLMSNNKNAFCFYANGGLARIHGGNYYAWTRGTVTAGSIESVCVYTPAYLTENVYIVEAANFPTYTRAGATQSNSIKINSGYAAIIGCCYGVDPATNSNTQLIASFNISKEIPA